MTTITGVISTTYTKAQIAQLLGMNYDSTNDILYMGTNNSTGFKFYVHNTSGVQLAICVNGTAITGSGARALQGTTLTYEITSNLVIFSFRTDGTLLDCVCAKYENTNGTTGYCYMIIHNQSTESDIWFDDVNDTRYGFSGFPTGSMQRKYDIATSTYSNSLINAMSLAPLIIQENTTNAKTVKDCYILPYFPMSFLSRYKEFMLDNVRYITACADTNTNYSKIAVKGLQSA